MVGAPDIYAQAVTLKHLEPYLTEDARVVAFGAKLSRRAWGQAIKLHHLFRIFEVYLPFHSQS
jgi:hypothetical protein